MLRIEEIMERIDGIKRLNAGKIKQKQAMNMLNLGRRQITMLKEIYERSGAEGIQHKPRSAPKLTDHKSINFILDSIINNAA